MGKSLGNVNKRKLKDASMTCGWSPCTKKIKTSSTKRRKRKSYDLIERSVTDSAKKMDLQYSNPYDHSARKDTGNISKSRIKRTRGLQASGSDSMAKD